MALHITNLDVEQKVRNPALVAGQSITDAIGSAADERMSRIASANKKILTPSMEEVMAMVRSFNLQPINEDLTDDEILGYGPNGLCE